MRDLVGLGFRAELAAGIFENLASIDVLEVLAEDALAQSRRGLRALRTLGTQVPLLVHGTSLGLASSSPADEKRLERLARVVNALEPRAWSEHLAFVRAGGIEIGHLAAPPRTAATIDGAARNVARARAVTGSLPLLENIATLVEPPGELEECEFVARVLSASGSKLLLDLHNLHANACNHGFDARTFLARMPAERIAIIHLAGGRLIGPTGSPRLLDDHLHPVPAEVFALLEQVASLAPQPLTVIVERDGRYPPMAELLTELDRAREALTRGRARGAAAGLESPRAPVARRSEAAADEALLARIFTDPAALAEFLRRAPPGIDHAGYRLAAESFSRKRRRADPVG